MNKILLTLAAAAAMSMSVSAAENVIFSAYDGNGGTLFGWGGGTMENVDEGGKPCFKFANTEAKQGWEIQACIETPLTDGETYHLSFDVKGDAATGIGVALQKSDGYADRGSLGTFDVTPEWKSVTLSGAVNGEGCDRVLYNLGTYVGTLYMTNIKLYTEGNGGDTPEQPEQPAGVSLLNDNSIVGNAVNVPFGEVMTAVDGVYTLEITANPENPYTNQLFVVADRTLVAGEKYFFSLEVKTTSARKCDMQAHGEPGSYMHWSIAGGAFEATTDWTKYTYTGEVPAEADGMKTIAINLSTAPEACTMEFKNIVWNALSATSIDAVEVAPVVNHWTVYNLMGVKVLDTDNEAAVNELANGIYVINGKKVAIRK